MRNFKFGIVLLAMIAGKDISAQPVLAAYNSNPVTLQQYTCIGVNYIQPPNSTGFTIWDFKTLVPTDTFITFFYGHGVVPEDSLFLNSDITKKSKNTYKFLLTSNQGISLTGYRDSLIYFYTDNADLIRYPFTYQDQYTDNYSCKYIRKNDTINRSGAITVSAPAYGNIKLPYNTINNVLCVKTFEAYNDFTKTGNEYHEITTYSWHIAGLSSPLISFRSENFNGNYKESGFYLTKESLGVEKRKNELMTVNFIKQNDKVMPLLNIYMPSSQTVKISCVNSAGQNVYEPIDKMLRHGFNIVNLPDNFLLQGLYLIIIDSDKSRITKKVIL